ncbi:peptidase family m13 domain-containing protein [Ditylenchus destructor]|uniref:Peptidase family m13 domain-containing protein n=1 Tax=Ditylenchus destructor TaxID=166010 RepID=A0AAD4MI05_9BILA|nr:peptidase family m13 domain-containing protein [Ditylenchus destructor]
MWTIILVVMLTGWTVISVKYIDEPELVEAISKNKQSINECKDYYEHICHGTKNIMYVSERSDFMNELKNRLLFKMRVHEPRKSDYGSDESDYEYELAKETVPEYLKKAYTFFTACENYYVRDMQGYAPLLQKLLQIRKSFENGLVAYNINWQIAAFPNNAFLDIFTTIGVSHPTTTAKSKYILSIKPAKPTIPKMETSVGWNAREKELEAVLEKVLLALIEDDCKETQGQVFGLCKDEKKQKENQQKEIKRRIKNYIKLEKAQIKLTEEYEKEVYKKQKAIFKKHGNDLDKIANELDKDEMEKIFKLSDLQTKLGKAYIDLKQLLQAHMPQDVWSKAFPNGLSPNTEILVQGIELVTKLAELGFNSSKNDPRVTADYLEMRVILAHAHAMGRPIVLEKASQPRALYGKPSIAFKNCVKQTYDNFPHQLDRYIGENSLWVGPHADQTKYKQYKAQYNKNVQKLFDEVKETFKEIVRNRQWHSESTKQAIEAKVTAIKLHMGYMKDHVKDEDLVKLYSDYGTITATSFLQMAMDVDLMRAKREFRALIQENVGYTPGLGKLPLLHQ